MYADPCNIISIIQTASLSAWKIAGGLSQHPCADAPSIVQLQSSLVAEIAHEHGITIGQNAATELALDFAFTRCVREASHWLASGCPERGNDVGTLIALTKAIGLAADEHFERSAVWHETARIRSCRTGNRAGLN